MWFHEQAIVIKLTASRSHTSLLFSFTIRVAMTHGGKISTQEMMDNQVPLHVRDDCAGILIPLNK